jgi:sec-independent protein translocase protein TatC
MPVIAYEIYKFIDPALYPREKKEIYPFLFTFTVLFIAGAIFGYKVLTILIIRALLPFYSVFGVEQMISVIDFYNMVFVTVLLSGVSFTIPIFFVLLVKFNILSTRIVTKNRLYIYAGLYIVCAFITPDGGPGSLIMMMPIVILLELGVIIAKRYERDRTSSPRIRLFESQTCKFCGKDNPLDTSFCYSCGRSQR